MQLKLVFPLSVLYIGFHAHPNRTLAHCNQSYGKTPLATCLATYALSLHNIPPQVNQIQQPISHTTNPCFEWNVCFTYLINFKLIFALLRPRTAVELATWISLCWQFYFLYLLNGFAFHIHFDRNFCNHIFHMKSKIHFFKQIWQWIKRDVCEKKFFIERFCEWNPLFCNRTPSLVQKHKSNGTCIEYVLIWLLYEKKTCYWSRWLYCRYTPHNYNSESDPLISLRVNCWQ